MRRSNNPPLFTAMVTAAVLAALALPAHAQMVTGRSMTNFDRAFGLDKNPPGDPYQAELARSSAAGNILWPGEKAAFTVKVTNNRSEPVEAAGRLRVIAYGTRGEPGDIWKPTVVALGEVASVPVTVKLGAKASTEVTVTPAVPEKFGGYALVLDLGPRHGRRFVASFVRTFKPEQGRLQYPSLSLDNLGPTVLSRLGVRAVRHGIPYKSTSDKDFAEWFAREGQKLRELHEAGVTVLAMFGGGDFRHPNQPLGRPRPWLDDQGAMQDTKFDLAWLPSYDPDFGEFVRRFAAEFGWPKGPVTAVSLWNEPWEGISISGWGADMLRYREIYSAMAEGTERARKEAGVDVLIGGADSSSNALDKLFPDGTDAFLSRFDFLSVHYQGMASFATYRPFVDREGPRGRVKVWDTESWVANTDDRVAAVIAANRSTGYDRAMGVFGGNIHDADEHGYGAGRQNAWSTAAAVGAAVHFVGERPFRELLFKNGLPWVMVFDGEGSTAEDGTLVVVGDLGEAFGGDNVLFRTARGLAEVKHEELLRKELGALTPAQAAEEIVTGKAEDGKPVKSTRARDLRDRIDREDPLAGATMTLSDEGGRVKLFDFYGNPVAAKGGRIVLSLDGRGYFLRGDGRPGAFAKVVEAVRASRVEGIEPLATVAHDFTAPVESKPDLRLTLTNVLNRPVSGTLRVSVGGLTLEGGGTQNLSLAPHETRQVRVKVAGGRAVDANSYPLSLRFDAGRDGVAVHHEEMRANVIARRTIAVDGSLDDWKGALGQTITGTSGAPSVTEAAWFPFQKFDAATGKGVATAWLACDADNFYFAAKVADTTPDGGTLRFETRDDDQFFYPATSYAVAKNEEGFAARWTGTLTVPRSGEWTLSTVSDDGVRLFVDDKSVIDNWGDHASTEDRAVIKLEAGRKYALRLDYYQSGGEGEARLFWDGPGQERQTVPASALTASDGSTRGLSAAFHAGRSFDGAPVATRTDPTVNFAWKAGEAPDPAFASAGKKLEPLTWPEGVRRFSYRKNPILPSGNAPNFDNVQIAFNVLPQERKRFYPNPPGTMPGYTITHDMDYEFALNKVGEAWGGGTEIWRLAAPDMPLKHFYPRQPRSPKDGPVKSGKLVVTQDATTRIVECAIPWTEFPEVKRRIDAGETVKFSFRVNDDSGVGCMELSRGRSVAKRGGSFHVDWTEHWENQVEFGVEKMR